MVMTSKAILRVGKKNESMVRDVTSKGIKCF